MNLSWATLCILPQIQPKHCPRPTPLWALSNIYHGKTLEKAVN
jgi:hypothetical protein